MTNRVMWLDDAAGQRLERIRSEAGKHFLSEGKRSALICNHGLDHCSAVEGAFHHVLQESAYTQLDTLERFLLLASPWVLYMNWDAIAQDSQILTERNLYKLVLDSLTEKLREELGLHYQEWEVLRTIVAYHNPEMPLANCLSTYVISDHPVAIRVRLLAACFRLSDVIHGCACGGPPSLIPFLGQRRELFHWLKAAMCVNIVPDSKLSVILLNFDRTLHISREIQAWMIRRLRVELQSLESTIKPLGIAVYNDARVGEFIGRPQRDQADKVKRICAEFGIAFPPNAGALQKMFLECIETTTESRPDDEESAEHTLYEIEALVEVAEQTRRTRPCHVGLERYLGECRERLVGEENAMTKVGRIALWARQGSRERQANLEGVARMGAKEVGGYTRFVLFGVSDTVVEVLARVFAKKHKRHLMIFICEAHNKSRIDESRQLEYVEGVRYAELIRERVAGRVDIRIIPDATVATVIQRYGSAGHTWVFLGGANGVAPDGRCGHSAGHLEIAVIASYFGIPLMVLCDSHKIGDLIPHPTVEREEQWLKGVSPGGWADERVGFVLENLRESIIPPELITKIITEDGAFTPEDFTGRYGANGMSGGHDVTDVP